MGSSHVRIGYEDFRKAAPDAYAALVALGKAAKGGGLGEGLIELVKIRVSQMNGCAFCLQHHLNIARALGVEAAKIDLVATWRDAGVFDSREMAALDWAESATRLLVDGVPNDVHAAAQEQLGEAGLVQLAVAVATINAWNRLGVPLRFAPPPRA